VNPRIGSGLKYGHRVEEEQTVEVVRNHAGGTRSGSGFPNPKEAPGKAKAAPDATGSRTPRLGRWRGDLWTTPREETRLRGRVARTGKRRESRRRGQEGRANQNESAGKPTGRRVRKGPVLEDRSAATCSKVTEGSGERPGSRKSTGSSPRRRYLPDAGTWSEPCPGAQAQHRHGGFAASAADSERQREERSRCRKALSPLKTR